MDSAAQYLSKNLYFNICHGKNSKVTLVDKFQKFRVETPLKYTSEENCPFDTSFNHVYGSFKKRKESPC